MQTLFDNLYKRAERLITSGTAISRLLDEVFLKIGESTEVYYKIQDGIIAMARMMTSWVKGDYKNISTKTVIAVIATLIYFVNPLDFIPDFIPVLGQIDDIFILGYFIKLLNKEIERFMAWENEMDTSKS